MPRSSSPLITTATVLLVFLTNTAPAKMPMPSEDRHVIDTVTTLFAALHEEDSAKFNSVIAPGFYIFDNGLQFKGVEVLNFIKRLHSSGKRFEWKVTQPDVHIQGNTAWIAYVNDGSITADGKTAHQQWLESGVLRKTSDTWRIEFMQSNRVPDKVPPK